MRASYRKFVSAALLAGTCFSAVFFSGCGTTPEVTTYVNPLTGRRTDILAENLVDAPGENTEMLWLNAYRDFTDAHRYTYYLEAIYGAREEKGYLEILPGRSLTIVADGQEMNFSGLGSLERDEEDGAVFESARYEATADDLYRISRASNVTVRLRGQNGVIVRQFADENFEKFRQFVEKTGADL